MQNNPSVSRNSGPALTTLAVAALFGLALSLPTGAAAQDRSRGDSSRSDRSRSDSQRRDSSRSDGQRRDSSGPDGSRRDSSRSDSTRRDDSRSDGARTESRRGRDDSRIRFTHSAEERRFENGATLRRAVPIAGDRRLDTYFPHHYYSYPHYAVSRGSGRVVISPFSFYIGIFPPYIERSAVIFASPRHVFIDVPVYVHGDYRPYYDGRSDYYLNHREDDRWKDDPELRGAVYDMEDAFRNEDIALLAQLTDPNTSIAIFAKGHYEYTLNPNDYLDMTRDFLRSAHTTGFAVERVHRKAPGVNQVFARHSYQDQDGQTRTVYLCVIMERLEGRWTITQIDSSPAHVSY